MSVPERWMAMAGKALAAKYPNGGIMVREEFEVSIEAVLADLRRQVEAKRAEYHGFHADYEDAMKDVLDLIDTGGSDDQR